MNKLVAFARCLLAVLAVALVLGTVLPAEACPNCKAALAHSETAGGDVVTGFFWSILFMMSMPFLLLGSFASYMYLAVRKARREQEAKAAAERAAQATGVAEQPTPEREMIEV